MSFPSVERYRAGHGGQFHDDLSRSHVQGDSAAVSGPGLREGMPVLIQRRYRTDKAASAVVSARMPPAPIVSPLGPSRFDQYRAATCVTMDPATTAATHTSTAASGPVLDVAAANPPIADADATVRSAAVTAAVSAVTS
jgi:hypothetical protein